MEFPNAKTLNLLFIGDIFDQSGVSCLEEHLPRLKKKYEIDFVVAQAENVSGRKGFVRQDYLKLKEIGVNAFTLGNHFLAKREIVEIIANPEIIVPANLPNFFGSKGSRVFEVNGIKIRVTSILGVTFNYLFLPWEQSQAENFFDAIDKIMFEQEEDETFHIIDFHAETTSEKNVLGIYLDGKVNAVFGTHTHVQTNDARILPKGTFFITDVGMVGPKNCAIGADFKDVYEKMRFGTYVKFRTSKNKAQFNGVVLKLSTHKEPEFEVLNF